MGKLLKQFETEFVFLFFLQKVYENNLTQFVFELHILPVNSLFVHNVNVSNMRFYLTQNIFIQKSLVLDCFFRVHQKEGINYSTSKKIKGY